MYAYSLMDQGLATEMIAAGIMLWNDIGMRSLFVMIVWFVSLDRLFTELFGINSFLMLVGCRIIRSIILMPCLMRGFCVRTNWLALLDVEWLWIWSGLWGTLCRWLSEPNRVALGAWARNSASWGCDPTICDNYFFTRIKYLLEGICDLFGR